MKNILAMIAFMSVGHVALADVSNQQIERVCTAGEFTQTECLSFYNFVLAPIAASLRVDHNIDILAGPEGTTRLSFRATNLGRIGPAAPLGILTISGNGATCSVPVVDVQAGNRNSNLGTLGLEGNCRFYPHRR